MKNIFLFILTIKLFVSCQQPNNSHDVEKKPILVDTIDKSNDEEKMKLQLREYIDAYYTGDADKVLDYIYPDVFEYFKMQNPGEIIDIEEAKKKLIIEPSRMMKKLSSEKQITFEFKVGEVISSANYNENKLFVVVTYVNAIIGKKEKSIRGEVIAVSNDSGLNWKFLENDPELAEGILKMKFPLEVTNSLLNKN